MLNVYKSSTATSRIAAGRSIIIWRLFWISKFHKAVGYIATWFKWGYNFLWQIHREFPYKSVSETILKIGLHLHKLWPKIKLRPITFFLITVYMCQNHWILRMYFMYKYIQLLQAKMKRCYTFNLLIPSRRDVICQQRSGLFPLFF